MRDFTNGRLRAVDILRPMARPAAAAAVGLAVVFGLRAAGSIADAIAALELMGFDPDRARLIADLVADATIVAVATLATRAAWASAIAGMALGGGLFLHQFVNETRAAMRSSGADGTFDLAGWVLTVAALTVAFAVAAWAAAALALIVRRLLLTAWSDGIAFVWGDRARRRILRPIATMVVVALVVATVPVFADMVNFEPDVHMRSGRAGLIGLAQSADNGAPPSGPTLPASVIAGPTVLPGASVASGSSGAQGVLLPGRPWTAWQPSGSGTITSVRLPAPWVGGRSPQAVFDVYLPPGYASSGRAYPVIYEVPWPLEGGWTTAIHVTGILDTLIDTGVMPASIVVFVNETGGPDPVSECANSIDHRQWLERYLIDEVVPYVATHARTIDTAAARSILGFSYGGFCAPMLALRHPDLFGTAIAFSGYYEAGIRSNQTPNSWRPFGGNAAVEARYSPLVLAGEVPPAERRTLFFELFGEPSETFYGPQYVAFASALHAAGISVALFPTTVGHSWGEVRTGLSAAMQTLGERQNELGVF